MITEGMNREVILFQETYNLVKRNRPLKIIGKEENELFKASFRNCELQKGIHRKKKTGKSRMNWTEETVQDIWQHIIKPMRDTNTFHVMKKQMSKSLGRLLYTS